MSSLQLENVEMAARDGNVHLVARELMGGDRSSVVVGQALWRHAHLLTRRPDLVLPAVYSLAWFASDECHGILGRWMDSWRQSGRGPWLRALRPPEFGLGAPIVAEYRGFNGRSFCPWPVGGDEIAIPNGRFVLDKMERPEGMLVLRRAGSPKIRLPVPRAQQFDEVLNLPNGCVVARGADESRRGIIVCADPERRELVWRTDFSQPTTEIRPSADARYLIVEEDGRGHVALDLKNGKKFARFPHAAGEAFLSPAGDELAVFRHGMVRVWAPEQPSSIASELLPWGDIDASFSPDGSLLLCGHILYDAATGQRIVALSLESTGPGREELAPGATRLVDGGVIEAGPRKGFVKWNAQGKPVLKDESRRYVKGRHCLSIQPHGRYYAVAPAHEPGPVEILSVKTGHMVRRIERECAPVLAWDHEGHLLANATVDGRIFLTPVGGQETYVADHPGVEEICFAWDGKLLATRGPDGQRLWRLRDSKQVSIRPPARSRGLDQWAGFRASSHGRQGKLEGGLFVVVGNRKPLAAVPCDEELVPSPDGRFWAGRHSHYALEE